MSVTHLRQTVHRCWPACFSVTSCSVVDDRERAVSMSRTVRYQSTSISTPARILVGVYQSWSRAEGNKVVLGSSWFRLGPPEQRTARAQQRCLKMSRQVSPDYNSRETLQWFAFIRDHASQAVSILSVYDGASAGAGSSGASAGQTGAAGGVDPQRYPGKPAGDAAEPAL